MAQSYMVLAYLLGTAGFCFGEGQGVRGVVVDGQPEGANIGSFICQQKCSNQDDEGVREIRDNTMFNGNHFGSCVCQQSCSGDGTITEDQMEAMLQIKMAAMTNKVESLQQTVDQLTQRTITEDRMEAMLQRMVSTIEIKMAATTNTVDGLQQTVTQPTVTQQTTQNQLRITCPADFVYNLQANICFKFYSDRVLTRADASTACQNLSGQNARLVVLDTQEKVQTVQEHLSAHYGTRRHVAVWIGGRQEDNEGRWLWETGQEVTGPWYPGQPNGVNRDCLLIYRTLSSSTWLLYDVSCSDSRYYICEH